MGDTDDSSSKNDQSKMVREHDNIIKNLRQEVNQLKEQAKNHEKLHEQTIKDLQRHSNSIDEFQKALREQQEQVNDMNNTMLLLKSLGSTNNEGDEGNQNILDALQTLIENLRKECYAKFANRDETQCLSKRIESLERDMKEAKENLVNQSNSISQCRDITDTNKLDIDDIKRMLKENKKSLKIQSPQKETIQSQQSETNLNNKDLEDLLKKLKLLEEQIKRKVDKSEFQNELSKIKDNSIQKQEPVQILQSQPSIFNDNEILRIKNLIEKQPSLEETLQKILNDTKNMNLQMLRDQITQIYKLIEKLATKDQYFTLDTLVKQNKDSIDKCSSDIIQLQEQINNIKSSSNNQSSSVSANDIIILRNRMEYIESQLSQMKKQLVDFKKSQDDDNKNIDEKNQYDSREENLIKELEHEMNRLRYEFQKFKDDISNNTKYLQDQLNRKIDKEELQSLESGILERLNEMIKKMLNQFADKNDTKKRLTSLEKNVKSILELLMSKGGTHNEEDAMFTKKPLGGLSCASCERNITNLQGQMADFQPWKKLPFREPTDRIAKVKIYLLYSQQYGPGFSKILSMLRPEQLEQSRIEQMSQVKRSHQDDLINHSHNNSTIQEHSIMVEMPSQASVKNSARTGNNFYKPHYNGNKTVIMKQFVGIEDSPPRINNNENSLETLPTLNIKGGIQKSSQVSQQH